MVYVDDYFAPYGRMRMSHLFADSTGELLAFAAALGLRPNWFQPDKWGGHFDVCKSVRAEAIRRGAKAVPVSGIIVLRYAIIGQLDQRRELCAT